MGIFKKRETNDSELEKLLEQQVEKEEEHTTGYDGYEYDEYSSDYEEEGDTGEERYGDSGEYQYDIEEDSNKDIDISDSKIKVVLDSISKQGNTIVVTGHNGCGKSTIAYNMANILGRFGYSTLVVDLDTIHKTQAFMARQSLDSIDKNESPLELAVQGQIELNRAVSLLKKNLYMVTTGVAEDGRELDKTVDLSNMVNFINKAKASYNFVIYDVSIRDLVKARDLALLCDKIALCIDASQWGMMSTITEICNIEDSNTVSSIMSSKTGVIKNRYSSKRKVNILGEGVNISNDMLGSMDRTVYKLADGDAGIRFSELGRFGEIENNDKIEETWCKSKAYSDTKQGEKEFKNIVNNMYL